MKNHKNVMKSFKKWKNVFSYLSQFATTRLKKKAAPYFELMNKKKK